MASDSVQMIAILGGELVTYTPYGGIAKEFKAVVERRPSQVEQAGGFQYAANTLEVWIAKDEVDGVMQIQERKDTVSFKKNLKDADVTTFTVNTIKQEDVGLVASDGGMFHLLVQA